MIQLKYIVFIIITLQLLPVSVVCRCIHCQKLAPVWQQLAGRFQNDGDVTIAEVDCSKQSSLCSKQGVSYNCNSYKRCFFSGFYRAALNAPRCSQEKAVCQTCALLQNGRNICPDFYTIQKII